MAGAAPLQLEMFATDEVAHHAPPLRERLGTITWSHSRRSTLERCARLYYYTYYGANRRTAKNVIDKEELHFLKGVATRHERAGSILHLAISWYLRETQKGTEPSLERLLGWARRLFEADRAFSRAHPDGATPDPAVRYPPVLLRELHYRDPQAEALCDETEDRMTAALTAFALDDTFAPFRLAAAESGASIETSMRLVAQLPCRVEGKVDFAFRDNRGVTVVDWKMGSSDGSGDDSLQLAVYALWAVEHFACKPDDLRVCKAQLGSRDVVDFRADLPVLRAARALIAQDAERMVTLHEYGQAGVVEAFSPCLKPAVCNGCRFQRACPEGSQLADA
jgi:hypothetical protein